MPAQEKKIFQEILDKTLNGLIAGYEKNKPLPTHEEISLKYGISISSISRKVIPMLQKLGYLEIDKRRAGYYYKDKIKRIK